jgi:hypothetical protein
MEASVNKPPDYSQRISNEQTPFSAQRNGQITTTSNRMPSAIAVLWPIQKFNGGPTPVRELSVAAACATIGQDA